MKKILIILILASCQKAIEPKEAYGTVTGSNMTTAGVNTVAGVDSLYHGDINPIKGIYTSGKDSIEVTHYDSFSIDIETPTGRLMILKPVITKTQTLKGFIFSINKYKIQYVIPNEDINLANNGYFILTTGNYTIENLVYSHKRRTKF